MEGFQWRCFGCWQTEVETGSWRRREVASEAAATLRAARDFDFRFSPRLVACQRLPSLPGRLQDTAQPMIIRERAYRRQYARLSSEEVPLGRLRQQHPSPLPRRAGQAPIRALRPSLRRHDGIGQLLPDARNCAAI